MKRELHMDTRMTILTTKAEQELDEFMKPDNAQHSDRMALALPRSRSNDSGCVQISIRHICAEQRVRHQCEWAARRMAHSETEWLRNAL